MPNDFMNVETPTVQAPDAQQLPMLVVDDIIPPRYPNGCDLVMMNPGGLAPVVPPINIPAGSILCLIPPDAAAHLRPALAMMKKQQEDARRRAGIRVVG